MKIVRYSKSPLGFTDRFSNVAAFSVISFDFSEIGSYDSLSPNAKEMVRLLMVITGFAGPNRRGAYRWDIATLNHLGIGLNIQQQSSNGTAGW